MIWRGSGGSKKMISIFSLPAGRGMCGCSQFLNLPRWSLAVALPDHLLSHLALFPMLRSPVLISPGLHSPSAEVVSFPLCQRDPSQYTQLCVHPWAWIPV